MPHYIDNQIYLSKRPHDFKKWFLSLLVGKAALTVQAKQSSELKISYIFST